MYNENENKAENENTTREVMTSCCYDRPCERKEKKRKKLAGTSRKEDEMVDVVRCRQTEQKRKEKGPTLNLTYVPIIPLACTRLSPVRKKILRRCGRNPEEG